MISQDEALNWLADLFGQDPGSLTAETPRSDIPNWDSLGVLTLMAALDEKFEIVVNDGDMRAMQSAGDVLALLRSRGKMA